MAKKIIIIIVVVLVVILVPLFWAARSTGFNVQAVLSKMPVTSIFVEAPVEEEPPVVPVSPLETENKELQGKIAALQEQFIALENDNNRLKAENEKIQQELANIDADQKEEVEQKANMEYMTELYKDMKPEEVVKIMDNMDDKTVLLILSGLESSRASKILAKMDPQRAALLTKLLLE